MLTLHNANNLKLLDAIGKRNQLRHTPDQTVHLDGANGLFQICHVGLIVPGLHIEDDVGLGNWCGF